MATKGFTCTTRGTGLRHKRSLDRHKLEKHTNGKIYSCHLCPYSTDRQVNLDYHISTHSAPQVSEEDQLMRKYNHLIKTHSHGTTKIQDKFNIDLEEKTMVQAMEEIFHQQKNKFKVNIAFGFILRHKTTEQLTFYYAYKNTQAFDEPTFIGNEEDLATMNRRLNNMDPLEYAHLRRPDTRFTVHRVANAIFYVTKIRNHPIGSPAADEYEEYLLKSRSMHALIRDQEGKRYRDNLCSFRCLALANGSPRDNLEVEAQQLLRKWKRGSCPGITLDELDQAEDLYNIRIFVYSLVSNDDEEPFIDEEDMPPLSAQLQRRPLRKEGQTIYLNLNNNHFSLIKNLPSFIRSWKCSKCNKLFKRSYDMQRHERACDDLVQYIYPGGGHGLPMNIFEKLKDEGLDIEDRFYPYRATYDFEARFTSMNQGTEKHQYVNELIPVSFSIATNIPGICGITMKPFTEPCCEIREPDALAKKLYTYLRDAAAASYRLMANKYSDICNYIDKKQEDTKHLKQLMAMMRKEQSHDILKVKVALREARKWEFIKTKFDSWQRQLPVLGCNSGKFDLNLIREYLVPHLIQRNITPHVIKKAGSYMSISTNDVIFLDVTNYLAAGTSYDKWLKAFEIKESKGHFPYEWLTSIKKLVQDHLPSHQELHSTLMQTNITPEEYERAQDIWKSEGFKTMRDYLMWYNTRDVQPFLKALERMTAFWKTLDIDMLKDGAISLPGLAYLHMFKTTDQSTIFPLFGDKEWHEKIRENIVGGPSIIFNRHKEVDTTTIRGGKPVRNIVGYDANSLYLWCIGPDMPTGHYGIWNPTDGGEAREVPVNPTDMTTADIGINICHNLNKSFKIKGGLESTFCEYFWVEWMRHMLSVETGRPLSLRHHVFGNQKTFNIDGSSLRVGGYIPELGVILQYHGCFFHGHSCLKNKDPVLMQTRMKRTEIVRRKLKSTALRIIEIYECGFIKDIKSNKRLKEFYDSHSHITSTGTRLCGQYQLDISLV